MIYLGDWQRFHAVHTEVLAAVAVATDCVAAVVGDAIGGTVADLRARRVHCCSNCTWRWLSHVSGLSSSSLSSTVQVPGEHADGWLCDRILSHAGYEQCSIVCHARIRLLAVAALGGGVNDGAVVGDEIESAGRA